MHQHVRVAGNRVRGDDLGDGVQDGPDPGWSDIAAIGDGYKCFGVPTDRPRVDPCSKSGDHALGAQSVNTSLDGRSRQPDQFADLAERRSGIFDQARDDVVINRVQLQGNAPTGSW